jgi:K+-transporting ATPase ATPase C chain
MFRDLGKAILLAAISVVVCCVIYPLFMWGVGQAFFPFQANGSMLKGPDGQLVGSKLIAQPFTKDGYFQPRPSAASYDASASSSSSLSASNYALRDRVARVIGPIAKYRDGKPVAPDVEQWFQQDKFQGQPHIVAQWADLHNSLAQAWVGADPKNGAYVDDWSKAHPAAVAQFVKDNPGTPEPKAADLAVAFFKDFSMAHPGQFPSAVTKNGADGKPVTALEPVKEGSDIQSIFFDMWRQDHAQADLQEVPGDLVTTSASGLDPHISLQNAEFQLERVAAKWAADLKRDPAAVRGEIEAILQSHAEAAWNGLIGEKFVNVLEVNLELRKRYGQAS